MRMKQKLGAERGITLVALIITIIVLIILAAVTINAALKSDFIGTATNGTINYANSQSYEQGMMDELSDKLDKLSDKIFRISLGEVVETLDNGVTITATITQNGDWKNPVVTVTGTITKEGEGSIISTTATATNGVVIPSDFPTRGGEYTIGNITKDTDIEIKVTDSEGKTASKIIEVRLARDTKGPEFSEAVAKASGMTIKISATATDDVSGVAQINYSVSPTTLDSTTPAEGTLESGKEKEIITTVKGEYTITFTAVDNAGNTTSSEVTAKTRSIDEMTVAEVKSTVNESNIADYIGTKVIDYEEGVIWRVFYVDPGTAEYPNGYFGDGAGTIYLKRDYDAMKMFNVGAYTGHTPSTDALNYMGQLNPLWKKAKNGSVISRYSQMEKMASSFYEQSIFGSYKNDLYSTYAIGAAPIEMWTKAHSIYKNKYETSNSTIECDIHYEEGYKEENELGCGYAYKIDGGSPVGHQNLTVANTNIEQSKVIATDEPQYLASPMSQSYDNVGCVYSDIVRGTYGGASLGSSVGTATPTVPLNK